MTDPALMTGADLLRRLVGVMNRCSESFLDRYTAEQLVQIFTMHQRCEYDRYPDHWTPEQVEGALSGTVPRFDDNGDPL